MLLKAKNSNQW